MGAEEERYEIGGFRAGGRELALESPSFVVHDFSTEQQAARVIKQHEKALGLQASDRERGSQIIVDRFAIHGASIR